VEPSIKILEGLHQHWVALLEGFTDKEWSRTFLHPQSGDTMELKKALALYAWHSKHHLAHITEAVKRF
ncbi:MAG: putative metal-dependent hydrolase, partial [Mucilaginibacter sp.]|nr:putative metal-dependent hydrolase [Mucilaginibacter sp.]